MLATRPSSWRTTASWSFLLRSADSRCRVSETSRLTSCWERPPEGWMVMFWLRPVAWSWAPTDTMPLTSISKLTSIWGTPLGAGGMLVSSNLARLLL